jgi:hypothetical protein
MDDHELLAEIRRMTDEEHRIERSHIGEGPLPEEELERLRGIEVTLDRCWDLLNQRRARRTAGQDPDAAEMRPASIVEHYQQ